MARSRNRLLGAALGAVLLVGAASACGSDSPPARPDAAAAPSPKATSYHLSGYGVGDVVGNGRADSEDLALLPPGEPGELASSAEVTAPAGLRAWRMIYHSLGPANEPRLVTGLVIAPADDVPAPAAGRTLVSFGHGTTGINDSCAPSRSEPPLSTVGATLDLVRAGNVLAISDYTGLGGPGEHPIYIADVEGRALLDAARAARSLTDAQVGEDVVLWGYSQGGQAALAAGAIAADYAPKLRVRGVAATAPLANLPVSLRQMLSTQGGVGYLLLAVLGVAATDPSLDPSSLLTPTGLRLKAMAHNHCAITLLLSSTGETVSSVFTKDPLRTEPYASALAAQWDDLRRPGPPKLVLQGDADTVIHRETTDGVVSALCATGGPVEYRRYPQTDHASVLLASMADLSRWITTSAAGISAPVNTCSPL